MTGTPAALTSGICRAKMKRRRFWHPWLGLFIMLAGTFMVVLDFFIVNVTIPAMQQNLQASPSSMEWVVAGYGLAYSSGLITGGRLGDIFGWRRMFAIGLILFTVASAACGFAPTASSLVLARVLQGAAAALVSPQVLAMLGSGQAGVDRDRAFAAYGITLGLGSVTGQLIGGLLMQLDLGGLGWRACFLVNIPIGLAALVLVPRLRSNEHIARGSRLDLSGVALVTLCLVAVIFPLIEGRQLDWPRWTLLCLSASLPLLLAFVAYESWVGKRGNTPLIDLTLFRERAFAIGMLKPAKTNADYQREWRERQKAKLSVVK